MEISEEELRLVLSQNTKFARVCSGLTQEQLAEKSSISLNFLKDIESGRSGIRLPTLISLCKSLDITPNDLLKDFFKNDYSKSENITQKINLLTDFEKDAVLSLINYFTSHNTQ